MRSGQRTRSGHGNGGHRRRRRAAVDPGGRRGRQARTAGQQGSAGDVRRAVHAGGQAQRRGAPADRQRAQRDLPVAAAQLCRWPGAGRRAPDPLDRLRRPVPRDAAGATRFGDAGAGLCAPELVDGAEDFRRFRQHDEQGARTDRGVLAVRRPAEPGRGGDPPAERDPLDGGLRRRLGDRPARQSGHAHADFLCHGLAGANRFRRFAAGHVRRRSPGFPAPRRAALPLPAPGEPGRGNRRQRPGHAECRERGGRGRISRAAHPLQRHRGYHRGRAEPRGGDRSRIARSGPGRRSPRPFGRRAMVDPTRRLFGRPGGRR